MKFEGLDELLRAMERANTELPDQMAVWIEEIGIKALQAVRKEILARNLVDTRNMLNSFMKGNGNNIWELQKGTGSVSLEVGSVVDYALYLEMGYVTKNGIPVYPKPYFTTAMRAIEIMIDKQLANKFGKWFDSL